MRHNCFHNRGEDELKCGNECMSGRKDEWGCKENECWKGGKLHYWVLLGTLRAFLFCFPLSSSRLFITEVFMLTCGVNCGALCTQVCVFTEPRVNSLCWDGLSIKTLKANTVRCMYFGLQQWLFSFAKESELNIYALMQRFSSAKCTEPTVNKCRWWI